jgi:hypothetical protein
LTASSHLKACAWDGARQELPVDGKGDHGLGEGNYMAAISKHLIRR